MSAAAAFAPYRPPMAPPPRDKRTAAALRTSRALAAVMWTVALATVAVARYSLM